MLEKLEVFGMTLAIIYVRVEYRGKFVNKTYPESCARFVGQPGVKFLPAEEWEFAQQYDRKFGQGEYYGQRN